MCHADTKWNNHPHDFDALYEADDGNYIRQHSLLVIDRRSFHHSHVLAEDRALHRYCIGYTGRGERIGILLKSPIESTVVQNQIFTGGLEIAVLSRTDDTVPTIPTKDAEDEKREQEASLYRCALAFATAAHLESNFLDPEYRERYAATYLSRILKEEKEHWLNLYRNVLSDPALYALLQSDHPHVMPYLESLLETARIADRLAVVDPKKKPKLTREEWEARIERYRQRVVDRVRVGADDKIAKLLARYKSLQHLRERAEQLGLDSNTIDRLEQELRGDMDDEDEEPATGFQRLS